MPLVAMRRTNAAADANGLVTTCFRVGVMTARMAAVSYAMPLDVPSALRP